MGGDTLDAALENMNNNGIVIICGLISGYNGTPVPVKVIAIALHDVESIKLVTEFFQRSEQDFDNQRASSGDLRLTIQRVVLPGNTTIYCFRKV